MDFNLNEYSKVILDASFFVKPFSDSLREELQKAENVYSATTFKAERAQYEPLMTAEQKKIFKDNLAAMPQQGRHTLQDANDLWRNLCALSKKAAGRERRYLLITSNRLLVQQVVLRELQVDVYNQHDDKFLPCSEFRDLKKDYELQPEPPRENTVDRDPKTASEIYDDDENIQLKLANAEGREAIIYSDFDNPNVFVKLFRQGHLSAGKIWNIRQLQMLNERLRPSWVVLPEKLVYWDAQHQHVAGYSMRRINHPDSLEYVTARQHVENTRCSSIIDCCLKIARQIAYLGVYGIYVSDHNLRNFAIAEEVSGHVVMWDADSFCQGKYYSSIFDGDLKPSMFNADFETPGNETDKASIMDICLKILYGRVFYMLTVGTFPMVNGQFVVHNDQIGSDYQENGVFRYMMPGKLWSLLEDVFEGRCLPSVDALVYTLDSVLAELKDNPNLDLTYGELVQRHGAGQMWNMNYPESWEVIPADPQPQSRSPESHEDWKWWGKPKVILDQRDDFVYPYLLPVPMPGPGMTKPEKKQPARLSRKRFDAVPRKKYRIWERTDDPEENWRERTQLYHRAVLVVLLMAVAVLFFGLLVMDDISWLYELRFMVERLLENAAQWWQSQLELLRNQFQAVGILPGARQ